MSKLNLTHVGRVAITVADTDRAIEFYVDGLGFEKIVDVSLEEATKELKTVPPEWYEVAKTFFG